MNNNSKLDTTQAVLFILVVMINKIILNFPKKIILTTGTRLTYKYILYWSTCYIILFITKQTF